MLPTPATNDWSSSSDLSRPVRRRSRAGRLADREGVVERLRADGREDGRAADLGDELAGHRVAAVQPDLAELADVAEAQLAAVGELQDEPDVRVLGRVGRDDEQLAGHLQVDGQRRVARRARRRAAWPADRRPGPRGRRRASAKAIGCVGPQRPRPRAARPDDRRADEQRPQVARDRLDLGELGHRRRLAGDAARSAPRAAARRPRRRSRRRGSAASSTPSRRRP